MPLALLDQQEKTTGMIPYWWKCHDYVLAQDRRLLEKLTAVTRRDTRDTFAQRVIDMFNIIKTDLI